ncbi:MAG: sensor histidine kinase [Caulobacter sp.]|nr:sensor histidine kinase [Caulobacter sp.]
MEQALGAWEFDPRTGRLIGDLADGLSFDWMAPCDREGLTQAAMDAMGRKAPGLARELRLRDPRDGSERWIGLYGRAAPIGAGALGLGGVAVDIAARKARETQTRLIIDELHHRARNALTIVQGLAAQTFRTAANLQEARSSLNHRLVALSGSHALLDEACWHGASVGLVVGQSVSFHGLADRIQLDGPEARMGPSTARALSMIVHELATNAMKYGAWSRDGGAVEVVWRWAESEPGVDLVWRERGGPRVEEPSQLGFGSQLISRVLPPAQGRVRTHYTPSGVIVTVEGLATLGDGA